MVSDSPIIALKKVPPGKSKSLLCSEEEPVEITEILPSQLKGVDQQNTLTMLRSDR